MHGFRRPEQRVDLLAGLLIVDDINLVYLQGRAADF
jgi:hypothetical protein